MLTVQQTFQCEHPVALVTGSGSPRVGHHIVRRLAALGCSVAIHAKSNRSSAEALAAQLRDAGCDAMVAQADLANPDAVGHLMSLLLSQFSRLDIVVNSAAIWEPKALEDVAAEDLLHYFKVNSLGSFLVAQAAGFQMVKQPQGGAIINISDWATSRPYLDHAAYFPSKGAVEAMTRSLAVELAHRNPNIRVNCIQPGPVLLSEGIAESTRQKLADSTLLKRIGSPDDIAHAVEFLAVNRFVTGVVLPIDGGRTIFANDGLQTGLNTG